MSKAVPDMSEKKMKKVIIYTDGGAAPNPGLGGWGAVLISPRHNNHTKELYGSEAETTNNRMELTAAIKALEALKEPCSVELHTDSQYLRNAFANKWLDKWQKNNWKTARKQPVLNQDLWQRLLELAQKHEITWNWVKGHADNPHNNRCDELCEIARSRHGK